VTPEDTGNRVGPQAVPGLATIGHSNLALGDFLGLLKQHAIETVADVRTTPRSRWVPHFSAGPLREALSRRGIGYVPFGRELGGRPQGGEFYDEQGHVLYGRLAGSPLFQEGRGSAAMVAGEPAGAEVGAWTVEHPEKTREDSNSAEHKDACRFMFAFSFVDNSTSEL